MDIEHGEQIVLAAYADDIVVITETKDNLKKATEKLIDTAQNIGHIIDENKTKCMIVSKREQPQIAITIKKLSFERVWNFKHLEVDVNSHADSHEKIHRRTMTGNKCYFSIIQLYKLKKLLRRTKLRLHKTLNRPIIQRIRWAEHVWKAVGQLIRTVTK